MQIITICFFLVLFFIDIEVLFFTISNLIISNCVFSIFGYIIYVLFLLGLCSVHKILFNICRFTLIIIREFSITSFSWYMSFLFIYLIYGCIFFYYIFLVIFFLNYEFSKSYYLSAQICCIFFSQYFGVPDL